ncbi:glycosyltransferase family 2 protein [Paraglaciecola aestuariivivens]
MQAESKTNKVEKINGDSPVWIIIVNFNSQDLVCRCIESLESHIARPFKVVVVDNSPRVDTDKIEVRFPTSVILKAKRNDGFAAGCNIGIEHAIERSAEFIMLLNPDTYTEQDFLSPMLNAFKHNSKLGMAGPTIYYENPREKLWMAGSTINWLKGGSKHVVDDSLKLQGQPINVPFMSGCCMLLRVKAIENVGLMDERYFLYFEDADYCEAFLNKGWQIAYVPKSEIIHTASSTTGFQSENYIYYFSRNRLWFLYKWAPIGAFIYYLLFTTLIKLPGSIIVFTFYRQRPNLTFAFLRGFIHGIKRMKSNV